MSISIHTISPSKGSKAKRKRVGRGNASGHGTYSGKGQKGQKARKGVSNLKRLGMKQVLLRTPKSRGFNSLRTKNQVVNLNVISEAFKDGDTVSPVALVAKQIIDNPKALTKILGNGKLTLKGLKFKNLKFSDSAKEQIEKNGGVIK